MFTFPQIIFQILIYQKNGIPVILTYSGIISEEIPFKLVVPEDKRVDEPAKIKNTRQIDAIIQAAEQVVNSGTPLDIALLEVALTQYKNNSEKGNIK